MNDSDAIDEAEAAQQAAEDQAAGVGQWANAQGEAVFGELVVGGRSLFFWETLNGTDAYVNLDHVTIVNWVDGQRLEVQCGDLLAWTTNHDTIARFWAEWEVSR